VSQSEVPDVKKLFSHLNPEISDFLFTRPKFIEDSLDRIHTLRGMTILDFSADNAGTSWEYPFFSLRVVYNLIALINKSDIDR
jgi:hypothetical protein